MAGQYDEQKHTRNKGKFAPKGQGAPGAGKPPTKPVRVQEGNIRAAGPGERKGGSGEVHPGDERIPNAPGGLDPEKLKKARGDREAVQQMMGQGPAAQPNAHQLQHTHSHAGHEAARGAMEAIESGHLEGASHHGQALQMAVRSLKESGATDEQLEGARKHLTALAHSLKAGDHIGAHTSASALKNEMFKIRHEAGQKAGLPPGGPAGPQGADPRFVKSLDLMKRQGMIKPEEYHRKLQEHIAKRGTGQGPVDEPGFGLGTQGTRSASVSPEDARVKDKLPDDRVPTGAADPGTEDPDAVDRGTGGKVKPQTQVTRKTDPLHGGSQGAQVNLVKELDKGANYAHGEYETESGHRIRKTPDGWQEYIHNEWRPVPTTDEEIHHYYGEAKPKYPGGNKP